VNRRRTFCDWRCVDEYLLRVEPKRMRFFVYRRDMGICQGCGEVFDEFTDGGWEADHIIPLWFAHATGDWTAWDPENLRLLCVPCHKVKTANDRKKYAAFKKSLTPSSRSRPRP
jgi:5-methylcytosine-specific restriction endonuclease McrA